MRTSPFRDIWRLFFPNVCAVCGCALPDGDDFMCKYCQWEMPLTRFWERKDNPVAGKFHGHLPVVNASSFYFFVYRSGFRDLIHDFKYRGGWSIARKMGEWYGSELAASGLYDEIDLIVPVPLHIRKRISRGYNQSEYIAEGISAATGIPVDRRSVRRTTHNRSQTQRRKSERWDNVEGIFAVRDPERLRGKHLLIVDDVLTTGATIISLGETILRAVPGCRISIATLAVSKSELETTGRT